MIELQDVTARDSTPSPPIWGGPPMRGNHTLGPVTLKLEAGAHAVLGTIDDGVSVLLSVIAGDVRARSGRVVVSGGSPSAPATRRAIAHVPIEVSLPEPLYVDEALAMAAEVRGEPALDPVARLAVLGVSALARRKVNTLAAPELRAVAMAEALTSQARVLLLYEPYVMLDPRAAPLLRDALRARTKEGVCIVVATASVRDATALADDQLVFERGFLVKRATSMEGILALAARGARLRVLVARGASATDRDGRALVAALASEGAITSVEAAGNTLVVGGDDLVTIASAVARAALRAEVTIEALGPDTLTLEELRASLSGDAAGAYRRAFEQGRSTASEDPSASTRGGTSGAPPAQEPA